MSERERVSVYERARQANADKTKNLDETICSLYSRSFLVHRIERGTENIINVFRYFVLFSSLR